MVFVDNIIIVSYKTKMLLQLASNAIKEVLEPLMQIASDEVLYILSRSLHYTVLGKVN